MTSRRPCVFVLLALLVLPIVGVARDTLPASLSDRDFWALTDQLSEPNGYFVSQSGSPDNLLSNEPQLSIVAAELSERVKPSGVYLGVGPEQNFTYIAAIKPRIAFITDIRRGNLNLHLLYKACFELSANRAEFVGRLFNRIPPSSLTPAVNASQLLNAYANAPPVAEAAFKANLKAVVDHLTKTRGFALSADDLAGVEYVSRNFYRFGLGINYTSSMNGQFGTGGTYRSIVGMDRTYLASEESFALIKTMESRNLIVPIVGDFAGPKALRALGAYLKSRGAIVSVFYVSNVEQYLQRNNVWDKFCANVASLPLDAASVFIRPGARPPLNPMKDETAGCAGR